MLREALNCIDNSQFPNAVKSKLTEAQAGLMQARFRKLRSF